MTTPAPESGPAEHRVDVQGLRLALRLWGPEGGLPVLALHGWLDNAATFDLLAPRLAGCRIAALDLPGHGQSEHRRHATYHFLDYVADALAAADALGWPRFALLGHSLGAGVAALVAGAAPDRVARLVAIEGLAPHTDPPALATQRLREAITAELAAHASVSRAPRVFADVEAAAVARARSSGLPLAAARVLVPRSLTAAGDGLRWSFDPRLRLPSRLRLADEHVHAFLAAIACPTLMIRARQGWPFDQVTQARRLACVRDLEVVEIDGGHHVHLEAPAAVAAAIARFLAPSLAATATPSDTTGRPPG